MNFSRFSLLDITYNLSRKLQNTIFNIQLQQWCYTKTAKFHFVKISNDQCKEAALSHVVLLTPLHTESCPVPGDPLREQQDTVLASVISATCTWRPPLLCCPTSSVTPHNQHLRVGFHWEAALPPLPSPPPHPLAYLATTAAQRLLVAQNNRGEPSAPAIVQHTRSHYTGYLTNHFRLVT